MGGGGVKPPIGPTFPLRITCKKGVGGWVGGWAQIACKIAYVLNGRPLKVLDKESTLRTNIVEPA